MKTASISKPKFIILSIKRNIIPTMFCLFTICLVLFSKTNLSATKSGLSLWATNVVPALLPFFIATELLSYTNVVNSLGNLFEKYMRPIFNVPGCGAYAFIMGIISGYPIGAKIVTKFREEGMCTKAEGERLLSFTNNSGPLFIIGTVSISLFGNTTIAILLFITHLLSSITTGILFRFWKRNEASANLRYSNIHSSSHIKYSSNYKSSSSTSSKKTIATFSNLGEILSSSILSAVQTVVMIGGFVILFSVILSILESTHILNIMSGAFEPVLSLFNVDNSAFADSMIAGIVELTNGVKQISMIPCKQISINIIITSFLLGFGGISVMLQVLSIISKSDISIKPYIIGKLLQGVLAAIYTCAFIYTFPMFNLNL